MFQERRKPLLDTQAKFKRLINCHYILRMSMYFQTTLILIPSPPPLNSQSLAKFLVKVPPTSSSMEMEPLKPPFRDCYEASQVERQTTFSNRRPKSNTKVVTAALPAPRQNWAPRPTAKGIVLSQLETSVSPVSFPGWGGWARPLPVESNVSSKFPGGWGWAPGIQLKIVFAHNGQRAHGLSAPFLPGTPSCSPSYSRFLLQFPLTSQFKSTPMFESEGSIQEKKRLLIEPEGPFPFNVSLKGSYFSKMGLQVPCKTTL